jgi:hypothetical protein
MRNRAVAVGLALVLATMAAVGGCSPAEAPTGDGGPEPRVAAPAQGPQGPAALPGRVYTAGPLTLAFEEGGTLTLNGEEEGTWTWDDGLVTVEAGDYTYYLQARDGGLYYGEMPLEPVEDS